MVLNNVFIKNILSMYASEWCRNTFNCYMIQSDVPVRWLLSIVDKDSSAGHIYNVCILFQVQPHTHMPHPLATCVYTWLYLHTYLLQGHAACFRHVPDISLCHGWHVIDRFFKNMPATLNSLLEVYMPLGTHVKT